MGKHCTKGDRGTTDRTGRQLFSTWKHPSLHMHVAMTTIIDPSTIPGGYSFEALKQFIAKRVPHAPVFQRRLVEVPFRFKPPGMDRRS